MASRLKYQTVSQRFLASLVDYLVFIPFAFLDELVLVRTNPVWLLVLWLPVSYSVVWLYSVLLHGYYGQTLGKRLLKIRVVDSRTEQQITMRQAFWRDSIFIIVNIISLLFAIYAVLSEAVTESGIFQSAQIALGYAALSWALLEVVTCLFNRKRRALHDFIAGTVVVKTDTVFESFAQEPASF